MSLPEFGELQTIHNEKIYYQLPESFYFKNNEVKTTALDGHQVAVLFYLLRDKGIIGRFTDDSLAKFIHLLTGYGERYAEKNVSTFNNVFDILSNKNKAHADKIAEAIRLLINSLNDILVAVESV
jgi:hypothetical protein